MIQNKNYLSLVVGSSFLSGTKTAFFSQRAVFCFCQNLRYNKTNMDPSEYYDFEGRTYINPMLSRDEQLGFIDTLRNTVGRNTAQINTQTKALGSNLPSTKGGLTGSNSYFAQRYQTAPLETQVNTLKATAQAKALNDLMTNYQNQMANRYNQAYRSAQKRASSGGTGSSGVEGALDYEELLASGYGDSEGGKTAEEVKAEANQKAQRKTANDAMAGMWGTVLGGGNLWLGLLSALMADQYQTQNSGS